MDEKTKELIAIGASVSGHCQPCLTFHVDQAKRLGAGDDEIKEAVAVGKMVQKGAMSAMNKFAKSILDSPDDSVVESKQQVENRPKTLKVYDPAMCCATGVCGPNVDKALVEFAGAVKTVAAHGVAVERFNLARQPQAFVENVQVKAKLAELGHEQLPFIYVDGEFKFSGGYPDRAALFAALGLELGPATHNPDRPGAAQSGLILATLPGVNQNAGGCCPGGGCC